MATSNGATKVFANVSALEIDRIVSLSGTLNNNLGTGQFTMPISYSISQAVSGTLFLYYQSVNKEIRYHLANNESDFFGATAYVVVEYTKQDN